MTGLYARVMAALGESPKANGAALWLTLAFALIPAAKALIEALSGPYVMQDDARQFVVWMARWSDPALFRGDFIADYFDSVTPVGFKALYWALWRIGIDPVLFHKLLPLPLALAVAYLAYRLATDYVSVPAVGFIAGALTTFFVSLIEDTASATPRAFAAPLFLALLCCLAERRTVTTVVVAALQALIYPAIAIVSAAMLPLTLLRWRTRGPGLSTDRGDWLRAVLGVGAIGLAMLPFALASDQFGPAVSLAEAGQMPALQIGGEFEFFYDDPLRYYLCGYRSGFLPVQWGCYSAYRAGLAIAPALAILLAAFAVGVPLMLTIRALRPGARRPRPQVAVLLAVVAASALCFAAAHIFLFQLHLPSRYGQHPLRATAMVALAVALAPALAGLAARCGPAAGRTLMPRQRAALAGSLGLIAGAYVLIAALPIVPRTLYVHGAYPPLYAFFANKPKESVVASISREADNVPAFGLRTVVASPNNDVPYQHGYNDEMEARARGLIRALYDPDIASIQAYIRAYGVDFLLLDRDTFEPSYVESAWWRHDFPDVAELARQSLAGGAAPAVASLLERCDVYRQPSFIILPATCLLPPAPSELATPP